MLRCTFFGHTSESTPHFRGVVGLPFTARVQRALLSRQPLFKRGDRGIPTAAVASSFLHSLLQGWPDCPLLRASSDHSFIVGALRAQRAVWLPLVLPLPRPRAAGAREFPGRPVLSILIVRAARAQRPYRPAPHFLLPPNQSRRPGQSSTKGAEQDQVAWRDAPAADRPIQRDGERG